MHKKLSTLRVRQDRVPQRFWGLDVDLFWVRDVMSRVTVGLAISGFLLVVNLNPPSVLNGF